MEREKDGQEPDALADTPEFLALKPKEQKFVMEYLIDFNGTRAAQAAGYGKNEPSSRSIASQILTRVNIQAAISVARRRANKRAEKKYDISRDALLNILAKIAHAETGDVVSIKNGRARLRRPKDMSMLKSFSYSESSGAQGSSTSFSFAVHDRAKAVETIAKMTGNLDGRSDSEGEQEPIAKGIETRLAGLRAKYSRKGDA